jgi:hypothetical protein
MLALLLVAVTTLLTRLLHDEIPSSIRAGVSSGVSTLQWMAFLPCSLAFGSLAQHAGVHTAGWIAVAATAATCVSLVRLAWHRLSGAAPNAEKVCAVFGSLMPAPTQQPYDHAEPGRPRAA